MEDICIVCAEPLQYTAYGGCGHKDACSKCVSRLRSVLKDPRCLYCQVPAEAVVVTRFMGGYTETVPPDEFETLPVGVGALLLLGALCLQLPVLLAAGGRAGGMAGGMAGETAVLPLAARAQASTFPCLSACRGVPSGVSFTTCPQPRHSLMTWRTFGR
jgi:hypothetical protein